MPSGPFTITPTGTPTGKSVECGIMNEHTPAGGAGPAIAAHSKDGLHDLSDKAGEGVERVKASVREATGNAREALSGGAREAMAEGGRAAGQAVEAVRDQPFI